VSLIFGKASTNSPPFVFSKGNPWSRHVVSHKQIFYLILLCFLNAPCAALAVSPSPTPLLLSGAGLLPLAGHLEILCDPKGALAFGDVLKGDNGARFKPIPGFLNRGYTSETTWVRFSLRRSPQSDGRFFLRLSPLYLDHVAAWVQTGPDSASLSSYTGYQFGDHHPATKRPMRHSHFVIPMNLGDEGEHLVYIQLRTTSSHSLMGWVYPPESFFSWSQQRSLLYGGFIGVTLFISFINIIYALRLKEMMYCYYAFFVLAICGTEAGAEGLLGLVWPSGAHLLSDYLVGGGAALQYSTFCLFIIRLFDTGATMPKAHRFFQFIFLFGIATFLAIPLGQYGRMASHLMQAGLVMVCFVTWLGFRLYRRGVPAGALFLASFLASNIGAVVAILRLLGLLPANTVTTYSFQIGALFHMVFMTLALTERVREAEENAVAASREAAQKAVVLAGEMTRELVENQKELEEALEAKLQALEGQRRFVEMVSHEYRNPLAILRTNVDLVEMKACGPHCAVYPNLWKMKRALARLVEVVDISLGCEPLGETAPAPDLQEVGLPGFMERIVEETMGLWGDRRVDLECSGIGGACVMADPALLKTAFVNLIDNAFKYSAPDEPVSIRVVAEKGEAAVAIRDNGRGIAEEELESVFENYYRGMGSGDTTGAGIGLYLVRRIVGQHGGRVSLARGDAGGAVATVRLPLSQ